LRLGSSSPQAMQCEIRRIVPRQPGRLGTRCQALPTRYRRRLTSNSCWSCSLRLGSSSPQAMQCEIRRIVPRQPGRLGTRCQALPTRYRRRLTSNSCWSRSLRLGRAPQKPQCEIRAHRAGAPTSLENSVPGSCDEVQEAFDLEFLPRTLVGPIP